MKIFNLTCKIRYSIFCLIFATDMVIFLTENQNQVHSGKSLSLWLNQKYKLFLIKKIPNISKRKIRMEDMYN